MRRKSTEITEAMKSQTFGVEIEMYGITRRKAAEVAAKYFGPTCRFEDSARRNGYMAWSAYDTQGREWKMMRDSSIAARDEEKCELVTPILKYEDIRLLQGLVRALRKEGGKSDPEHTCGVHIHVGADIDKEGGHTAKTLRNLTNLMASHEKMLIKAIRIDRGRIGTYCRTVDPRFLAAVNTKKPDTVKKLLDIWYASQNCERGRHEHYNDSRYHMLNLHAVGTKGTIEFRLFQYNNPGHNFKGGLHAGMTKAYVQLCLALSQMAKMMRTASPREPQVENPKYAMRCWLLRLGFIGDEYATARDILTRNLEGDTAWRHGRPERTPAAAVEETAPAAHIEIEVPEDALAEAV